MNGFYLTFFKRILLKQLAALFILSLAVVSGVNYTMGL